MASYPRPTNTGSTFNSSSWVAPTVSSTDTAFLNANYCQFPTLQGAINTKNITTTGNVGVSSNIVMNGTLNTNFIQFPDGSKQYSAPTDDINTVYNDISNNFSELNTFNANLAIGGVFGVNYIQYPDGSKQYSAPSGDDINTVYNDVSNTFLSPTIQKFQGSNATLPSTGPLQITNVSTSEYASFFVDPSPTYDLTLYTAQTGNTAGLTVRNPNYSFSVNPTVGNVATFVNPILSTYSITGNSFGVNTTGSDAYSIYSNTTPSNYGLVIANTTGGNGSLTLSNNGTTLTTLTSTSTGLTINDPLSVNGSTTATSFKINTGTIGYDLYSIESLGSFGLYVVNTSNNNGKLTLSNNGSYYSSITSTAQNEITFSGTAIVASQTYPQTSSNQVATISYVNQAISSQGGGDASLSANQTFTGTNNFSDFCGTPIIQTYPQSDNQFITANYLLNYSTVPYPSNALIRDGSYDYPPLIGVFVEIDGGTEFLSGYYIGNSLITLINTAFSTTLVVGNQGDFTNTIWITTTTPIGNPPFSNVNISGNAISNRNLQQVSITGTLSDSNPNLVQLTASSAIFTTYIPSDPNSGFSFNLPTFTFNQTPP